MRIRIGYLAIRNVGSEVVESIIKSRHDKGAFTSFSDYLDKIELAACTKRVTEALIKAGAFDDLNHPRKGLMLIHEGRSYGFFFPVDEGHPAKSSGEVMILEAVAFDEDGQPSTGKKNP